MVASCPTLLAAHLFLGKGAGLQDADVADLSQEVFTILFRTLPDFTYDKHKSFRGWLRTVTLNKWRALQRRRGLPIDAGDDAVAELADLEEPGPWEEEHTHFLANRALQLMCSDFEDNTWRACWEMVMEERPAAEVAAALGMTVAAVYTAKSRVLRQLRRELDGLL